MLLCNTRFIVLTKTKIEILLYISLLCFLSWKSYYNIGIKVMVGVLENLRIYNHIYMYIPIQHSSSIASLIASPNFLIFSQQQYRKYRFSDLNVKV